MGPKKKAKEPFIPADRHETVRKEIISFLQDRTLSAMEISGSVGVPEKAVYEHLCHIQKTLHKKGGRLIVIPPECRKCGFKFKKREKLKKPGKCPICRSESVTEPLFLIK